MGDYTVLALKTKLLNWHGSDSNQIASFYIIITIIIIALYYVYLVLFCQVV